MLFLICVGFRFAIEFVFKIVTITIRDAIQFQQPSYLKHPSSQNMFRREHSALLHRCQYVFPHVKPSWLNLNRFASNIWNALPNHLTNSFHLFLLFKKLSNINLFLLAYHDSSAKSGNTRSNQLNVSHFMILRQLLLLHSPDILNAAQLKAFHLSAYD